MIEIAKLMEGVFDEHILQKLFTRLTSSFATYTTCISTHHHYNGKRSLISALPERNNLRTRGQTSMRNSRSVPRSEPNAPKSAQVATRNAPRNQTEARVPKDSRRHGQNRDRDPAYPKANSADGPRA